VHTIAHCPHCGATLDALARLRGATACGASACRHADAQVRVARLKQDAEVVARASARALGATPGALPVVWLHPTETGLAVVSDTDRAAHRATLQAIAAEGRRIDRTQLAEPKARDGDAQGARLCGHCGGHCCMHGAGWHAFIDATLLQQFVDQTPGSTLDDAVQAYVDWLPAEHVHGSCLYHGASGCAMPRERRSYICNGFACTALEAVQDAVQADAAAAVVALTLQRDTVTRGALITPEATQTLPLPP
jgi:hypothetical protein